MASWLRRAGIASSVLLATAALPLLSSSEAAAAAPNVGATTASTSTTTVASTTATHATAAGTVASTTTPYVASVAIASTADGGGYWEAGVDGAVFSFGDAQFYGSLPQLGIAVHNIDGMAATPDGRGYWLLGADGGVFSFGDAGFYGSVPGALGRPAPYPVTDIVPTADGHGYWLVASDGGVFSFGDAHFYGSLPGRGIVPNDARVAQSDVYYAYAASTSVYLQPTPDGHGYWIADSSGDVYTFGDAAFYGSLPGTLQAQSGSASSPTYRGVVTGHQATVPITAFVATPDGKGYWMVGTDGNVYTFGDAKSYGSLPSAGITVPPVTITGYTPPATVKVNIPLSTVSSMARTPNGSGYWLASLNGGVFSFGNAGFHGSVPGIPGAVIHSVAAG